MRRHWGRTLLAVGWLLMSPPLVKDDKAPGGRPDPSAKIDDWIQVSAHDTATDCERAKSEKAVDLITALHDLAGRKNPLDEPAVAAALQAICVPASYVYGTSPSDGSEGTGAPGSI